MDYHVGPKWNLKYLFIKEEIRRKFNIHRREGNVTAEAERQVMWLQVKKCWQPPDTGKGKA